MTSTPELKPCPFCGGEATEDRIEPHKHHISWMPGYPGSWSVECHACEFRIFSHDSREAAIAAWSRRSEPADTAALRKDAERYRFAYEHDIDLGSWTNSEIDAELAAQGEPK